ncbi:hypothetical protein Droror1_Dr00001916 [Drosera rotundifolia]
MLLPQDCLSTILSLTSPPDVCRSSTVSTAFRFAAESDLVWEKLLPCDYLDIISRADDRALKLVSKKELFLCFCGSVSIDGGSKIFTLDKSSGLKSYVLAPRELSIAWSKVPMYWTWRSLPKSRFAEVAELGYTHWLEIHGKIKTQMLSPNKTYTAVLIFSFLDRSYGLDTMPMVASIELNDQVFTTKVFLSQNHCKKTQMQDDRVHSDGTQTLVSTRQGIQGEVKMPNMRNDGWVEIELGEFFSGEDNREVKMSLLEITGCHLKGGLIIEGLQVRPV